MNGERRPSIPAGTGGIGTVRPWAPALGSPGRPKSPDPINVPPFPGAEGVSGQVVGCPESEAPAEDSGQAKT